MPQPTQGDVHVNRPLSNISIAYLNMQDFIAHKVFPNVPVNKQSDAYFVYPKDQWFRTDAKPRGVSQESAGSGYELDTDTYYAKPQALHKDVDDQIRANADAPINLDAEATEFVTRQLALRREKDGPRLVVILRLVPNGTLRGLRRLPIFARRSERKSRKRDFVLTNSFWRKMSGSRCRTTRIS
jgi:hypothetical protein